MAFLAQAAAADESQAADVQHGRVAVVRSPALTELSRTLRRARSQPDLQPEALVVELDAVGEHSTPAFLELLECERVPPLEPGQIEQVLSEPQREILLAALARRPVNSVISALDRRLELAHDCAGRLLAVRVLGAVGSAQSLERVVNLALAAEETEPSASIEAALRRASASILLRDVQAFGNLEQLLPRAPQALRTTLVQSAGDTQDTRGLPILSRALALQADLAPVVAAQVSRIGRSLDVKVNQDVAERLRGALQSNDPGVQRTVALALGELRDEHSIPTLIELLDSGDPGLSRNVAEALRRCTGLEFGTDAARWRRWYSQERSWFARDELAALRDLQSRDPAKVSTALHEIGRRRTERDALASEVIEVLRRAESALRAQACDTLAALGSSVALPALVERLASDVPFCSQSAWRALCSITELDLPADAAAWREALDART